MLKHLLFLTAVCGFISQSAFAGYIIEGADDDELQQVSRSISVSRGRIAPQGWKIDENQKSYRSTRWDNVEGRYDASNYLKPLEIEEKLSTNGERNKLKIQRLSPKEISCEIERYDHDVILEGEGVIHYIYTKLILLHKLDIPAVEKP